MIDPKSYAALKEEIRLRLQQDKNLLDQLRNEIKGLSCQRIRPQSTTSIALVATDGGNNKLKFDPFLVQLIRVVDSSNNEYCLEAITPSTDVLQLSQRQFDKEGNPVTALGKMMNYLGVKTLPQLSPMIKYVKPGDPVSPSWVQVYRELIEWAILFSIITSKDFATDTMVLFDGLLRSKVFSKDLFRRLKQGIWAGIEEQKRKSRRNIYLAGVAKHSKVLERYRLAMVAEGVMMLNYPCYSEVSREIEEKAYVWGEYARGDDREGAEGEINKYVAGKMYLVKFGTNKFDPIWPIDIFEYQANEAAKIIGCMLEDAKNGFPVPHYPACLQRAHENAALVDFDSDVLQDEIVSTIRGLMNDSWPAVDAYMLQDSDPASKRY